MKSHVSATEQFVSAVNGKIKMQTHREILPPVFQLLVFFRKNVWLMFVGIFMPFPSVHLCISSLQTSFIIAKKKLVCPRKCSC